MTINDTAPPLGDVGAAAPAWSSATIPTRLIEIAVAGMLAGILMILAWMGLRPDLDTAPETPMFWLKALYTGSLAGLALGAMRLLSRRAGGVRRPLILAGVLVAAILIAAAFQAPQLEVPVLAKLFRPTAIRSCLFNIISLAAPMLLFAILGLRDLDMAQPVAKGLGVGLFCGAVAATVYGLHCPHWTYVFVGLWYTTAIALCGLIGAVALGLMARRRLAMAE